MLLGSWVVAVSVGPAGAVSSDLPPLSAGDVVASAWHHARGFVHGLGIGSDPGSPPLSPMREAIIWHGRLPRVAVATAVGAGLAISGAVMQQVVRNPLADPYLLGLSSGASLGAVAVLVIGVSLALPVAAFAGAIGALVLTLALAGRRGVNTPSRMILAGVAVAQGASALVSFII
ncbi:MAG TPA: iron chelate uptake ABC transporter family permease subunit, partial [Beutenbergiaceae bacterium]|nr:iron chelate uptake ABC transporter family permease subunit [Beutenbergiaceae bacterium]